MKMKYCSFLAVYDLRCIRERRPGFNPPPSLKKRELSTAVSRRVREEIEGNKDAVMWGAEDNCAGKTKLGGMGPTN